MLGATGLELEEVTSLKLLQPFPLQTQVNHGLLFQNGNKFLLVIPKLDCLTVEYKTYNNAHSLDLDRFQCS